MAAVAAAVTGTTLGLAPTAHADVIGSCTLNVPSQVRVVGHYQHIVAKVSGGCSFYAANLSASWDGYTTNGMDDFLWFDQRTTEDWDVYDFHTLGRVTWRPSSAGEDATYNEFTQNTPVTDIRVGSWASIGASRSGTRVNLWGNGTRYSPSWGKNIAWQSTATIQYRAVGSSTWRTLTSLKVNGGFKYSYTTSAVREYRVQYAGTSSVWPASSSTVKK